MTAVRRVHKRTSIQPQPHDVPTGLSVRSIVQTYHKAPQSASIVIECILGLIAVVIPLSVHAGVFSLFNETTTDAVAFPEVIKTDLVLDTPVLTAAVNADPNNARGGADILATDGALVATGPVGKDEMSSNRNNGEISVYTVRDGDSLSMIAEMFDVTTNTILWANDLASAKAIKPGQTLIILPVEGVRHVVKSGDTIDSIAKKYDGKKEEILSFNQLTNESDLTVGMTLVIPGGALHTAVPAKVTASVGSNKTTTGFSHPVPGAIKTQGIHGYNAVDFGVSIGTSVRAAAAGEVIVSKSSGWNGGYGQYIVIKHANGTQSLYAHLSANTVGVGDYVTAGEVIGASGNTGKSTGPHLHFEVRGAKNPF